MYYKYQPYPYYRKYYNINPYYYGLYYNYRQNIIDSQIANVNQNINNYGSMTDVIQNSNIHQSMTSEPEVSTETAEEPPSAEVVA